MASSTHENTHLPVLDGFRGFSILAVLAAHMLPLGPNAWGFNSMAGHMGMSVFFALSGFLICRFLWDSQNIPQFFIRRVARIAPLVLLVTTIYCLMLEGRVDSFIASNLYVVNYWSSAMNPSISPLWSLAVEMHFYVAIGLSILLFGRRGFWMLPIGAAIVLAFRAEARMFGDIATHFRADEILTGGMLAVAWVNRDHPIMERIMSLLPRLFWLFLILWMLSCHREMHVFGYFRGYFAALLIGSVLLMRNTWQVSILSTKSLKYIATISFALYVWHSPFREYWFAEGGTAERYLIKRPIAFASIFLLAHLSTFYFEQPIVRAIKRLTSGSKPKTPVSTPPVPTPTHVVHPQPLYRAGTKGSAYSAKRRSDAEIAAYRRP